MILLRRNGKKTNAFNQYFCNVSSVNAKDKNIPLEDNLLFEQFGMMQITEQDVIDQLETLNVNKAYGHDAISPKMLKEAGKLISKSLQLIFYFSIRKGIFPQYWKKANVLPLFKKGS